jgi:hypothetical protein
VTLSTASTRWLRPNADGAGLPDLVLRLTAIVLLLRPLEVRWAAVFVLLGAVLSVLFAAVRRSPITWLALALLIGAHIVEVWPVSDNHIYLLAYWCLAIGIALATTAPAVALGSSSRWLTGAAFTFAVIWKGILSPDYLDGRFFRVTLLTDDRFADAVMLVGDMTAGQIRDARAFLQPLPEGAELADADWFGEPPRLRMFGSVVTWGGILLEGLVAVLSLIPLPAWAASARHLALLLFCVTTYALAPVAGFGWLLVTMGLAQCRPDERILQAAYVVVFVLVLLYAEIPWAGVLAHWS